MDDTVNSSVNDDELNQMIANLQNKPAAPPSIVSNSGTPVVSAASAAPVGDGNAPALNMTAPTTPTTPAAPAPVAPAPTPVVGDSAVSTGAAPTTPPVMTANPELENIKRDALSELRPLVDKLDLPAEEKFDTLLLIIRSTDDSSLLPQAHAAAKQITDETRRAQALLDVIKEIDFFGQNK